MSGAGEHREDVLVVGAGIVGAACADALVRAGLSVRVLDAAHPASKTTAAAMGHVVVMDDSEAQFALTQCGRRLWAEWSDSLPASVESEAPGTLWIAADDEEMAGAKRRAAFYAARGVSTALLDGDELQKLERNLRPGFAGALWVRDDRLLYPPVAAKALLDRAGCVIETSAPVSRVFDRGVRLADGREIVADHVLCALGPWTPALLPEIAIIPRRGHLMITERRPGFIRHPLVELGYLKSAHSFSPESVAFNLQPRKSGQMLLGSSREFIGLDPTPNRRLLAKMTARAFEYMPALAGVQVIRTWVGFRPCAPDNLPFIGRYAPLDGVWIAAGHEGLGITTAPATGRLIADLITGRTPVIDPRPFDPNRTFENVHG